MLISNFTRDSVGITGCEKGLCEPRDRGQFIREEAKKRACNTSSMYIIVSCGPARSRRFARVNTGSEHCYSLYDSLKTISRGTSSPSSPASPDRRFIIHQKSSHPKSHDYFCVFVPSLRWSESSRAGSTRNLRFLFCRTPACGGANLVEQGLSAPKHRFSLRSVWRVVAEKRTVKKITRVASVIYHGMIFSNSLSRDREPRGEFGDARFSPSLPVARFAFPFSIWNLD